MPVSSTYTEPDGTFELYNIPEASYELLAESTDSCADDHIQVQSGQAQLQLRQRNGPLETDAPTVSGAQMMVPPSAEKLYRKATDAFRRGKYDKAKSFLDNALQIDPQCAQALTLRGQIEMSAGNLAAAQQYLERAVHNDPSYSAGYVTLSAVYNHQGKFDDAMHVSERSLSLPPNPGRGISKWPRPPLAKGCTSEGFNLPFKRNGSAATASRPCI